MEPLDSTTEATARSTETDERGRAGGNGLVSAADDAPKSLYVGQSGEERPVRPIARRRFDLKVAALLIGGCTAGLLLYGSAVRLRNPPPPSVTSALPSALDARAVANLPPPNLLKPLSPDEASKENAERPFVNRPDTPASRFVLRTEAADRDRAITCLAQAVYYEAAGEGTDGQRAVAQIVLNRLHHPGFPSTVCGVVYQGGDRATGCQFSFVCDGSMQRIPAPSLWARSRRIAAQALSGTVFAPVGHATHYHADYVLPYWADSLDKSVQVGHHIFYRLRSIFGEPRAFSQRYGGTEPPVRIPGAAVVLPPTAATSQLGNTLISDGVENLTKDVEKAASNPRIPLLIDSVQGTLLADGTTSSRQPKTSAAKSSGECAVNAEGKLKPLRANDMRAGAGTVC